MARHARRIVRLRDGHILSDFSTELDPVHREYMTNAAAHLKRLTDAEAAAASAAGPGPAPAPGAAPESAVRA